MGNTIGNNKFLRLTSSSTAAKSKTSQLNQVKNAANNIRQAQTSYRAGNVQNRNTQSIFSSQSSTPSSKTSGGKTVSYEQFTQSLTGKKIDELTKAEKAQMQLVAAFADADGDNKINETEAKNLAALDGDDKEITQKDIDKLYEELGVTTEAELEDLLADIDDILNGGSAAPASSTKRTGSAGSTAATASSSSTAATASSSSTAATSSTSSTAATSGTQAGKFQPDEKMKAENGILFDEKTGEYSVVVEKWTGANGENSSLYGIMSNAYPQMSSAERQQVLNYIQEMNPEITDVNLVYTNQNIKLPVLTYDESGNVSGYKKTADEVKETESTSATGSTAATSSTGSAAATSATSATGSTAATASTGSTAATSGTTASKNAQYIKDVVANAEEFLKNADDDDYSDFTAYVEKSLDNTSLSDADKLQMFNDLLKLAKSGNIGYEFVTSFGDKISSEDKADAVLNLVNDKNYQPQNYTNIANDYVLASMKDMIADGNIDKALELEDAYNKRFGENNNTLRYSSISTEDWANYTAELYSAAAKQGRLDDILKLDQYDSVTALQDGVKGKKEDKVMSELFANLSETLPDEINLNQADADAYEVKISSGSVEENLNEVLNSTTLNDSQKAYYLKQIMSSNDFVSEFRDMKAGKQEGMLKDILAQVAKYTSV